MTVTRIQEYRARGTIEALRELLARAEAGRLHGFAFAFKTSAFKHRYGFTGDYADNPHDALGAVTRMEYKVNQAISVLEEEPVTRPAAL